jgi:menaquinone-9 beta-reductase
VLLVGDAAGLINPLQGEGIAPGMVSARLAAEAVLAHPAGPGPVYAETLAAAFGGYMPGAAALQDALLRRPRAASAGIRLLTAPGVRRLMAGTWSLYWNGLVDGAQPRPSAWSAGMVQRVAGLLAARTAGRSSGPRAAAVSGSVPGRPGVRAGQR